MTAILQNLIDAISVGSLYALFALGVAVIFSVAGIINFAHGDLIMVCGYLLLVVAGIAWPLVVVCVVVAGLVVGLAMDRAVFRPLRGAEPVTVLIGAFMLSVLVESLVQMIAGARPKSVGFADGLTGVVELAGVRVPLLDLVTVATTLVLLAALGLLLHRSSLGRQLRAAAEDFGMARLLGVRAGRVITSAFAVSGCLGGVAALLFVAQTGSVSSTMGVQPVLIAFIACVIGGMGSLIGAVLGGYLLGLMSVALEVYLPAGLAPFHDALLFGLVIATLLLRPQGLVASPGLAQRV